MRSEWRNWVVCSAWSRLVERKTWLRSDIDVTRCVLHRNEVSLEYHSNTSQR
jgi:hypothetical protein